MLDFTQIICIYFYLSTLTSMLFNMGLTHLGSEAFKYVSDIATNSYDNFLKYEFFNILFRIPKKLIKIKNRT